MNALIDPIRLLAIAASRKFTIAVISIFMINCSPKPFVPVNEGREYGNPKTPLFVMHALEKNQWSLRRVDNHGFFKRLICFHYTCRKMIGRSKTLLVISKKEYIKVIKKNAERGFFNTSPKFDTTVLQKKPVEQPKDSLKVLPVKPITSPILKADSLITLNDFLFETNSFKLKAEHHEDLETLSEYLISHPTLQVEITGHTDNTGEERHNVTLSTRRAESVAEFLVGKGVNYDKIIFKGVGSSQPMAPNNSPDGRSKNRRVEILIRKE